MNRLLSVDEARILGLHVGYFYRALLPIEVELVMSLHSDRPFVFKSTHIGQDYYIDLGNVDYINQELALRELP